MYIFGYSSLNGSSIGIISRPPTCLTNCLALGCHLLLRTCKHAWAEFLWESQRLFVPNHGSLSGEIGEFIEIYLDSIELESCPDFSKPPVPPESFCPISEDDFELLAEALTEVTELIEEAEVDEEDFEDEEDE